MALNDRPTIRLNYHQLCVKTCNFLPLTWYTCVDSHAVCNIVFVAAGGDGEPSLSGTHGSPPGVQLLCPRQGGFSSYSSVYLSVAILIRGDSVDWNGLWSGTSTFRLCVILPWIVAHALRHWFAKVLKLFPGQRYVAWLLLIDPWLLPPLLYHLTMHSALFAAGGLVVWDIK